MVKQAILTVTQNSDTATFTELANALRIISVARKSVYLGEADFSPIYCDWQVADRLDTSTPGSGTINFGQINGHVIGGDLLCIVWEE